MRARAVLLAAALVLAATVSRAADLVVWWEQGYHPEEDQAVRETVAAFEHKTGRRVELVLPSEDELTTKALAALEAGHPPDLLYGLLVGDYYPRWAQEGRLVDLTDALGPFTTQFDRDALAAATLLDATTGRRGLYLLPLGLYSHHVHVWKSLLERAGLRLEDIPKQWEPFWSFWCDKVQPAVREATGRDDVYGIGLPMSVEAGDTGIGFWQFVDAYGANYVTRDGRLVIDEPAVRAGLVKALDVYTAVYKKGCTPPGSVDWTNRGNNQAFLEQRVVMTVNSSLSIPGALRTTRPDDYYENAVTLGWPADVHGQPLAVETLHVEAAVFRDGGHVAAAAEFVRFLVGEGWLAHWLDFTGDRFMPPMPALAEQPFWLNPGDPHRMTAAIQLLTQPRSAILYDTLSGDWRHARVDEERVWPRAVHRVAAEGVTPERAVDEAIARVHQILSE